MSSCPVLFGIVALCLTVFVFHAANGEKSVIGVEVYYETLCGDSVKFINQQLVPSYSALKDHLDISFVPYGKASHVMNSTGSWEFTCQHGLYECLGNREQACALEAIKKHEPIANQQSSSVAVVGCVMGKNYNDATVGNCIRTADVTEATVNEFVACKNNENVANDLLVAHGERTKSLNPTLSFVPTITINKIHSKDDQSKIRNDFANFICESLPKTEAKPVICAA